MSSKNVELNFRQRRVSPFRALKILPRPSPFFVLAPLAGALPPLAHDLPGVGQDHGLTLWPLDARSWAFAPCGAARGPAVLAHANSPASHLLRKSL